MLTADQIAAETGLDIWVVRYRLSELRRNKKIKSLKFGTTFAYPDDTIDKVKDYSRKELGGNK